MRKLLFCLCALATLNVGAQYASLSQPLSSLKPSIRLQKADDDTKKKPYEADYKSVVSVFPLRAISSYMMAGIETAVTPKSSLRFVAGYATFEGRSDFLDFDIGTFSGFRFELMWKNFIGKNAKVYDGFYFAPNVVYKECFFTYYQFSTALTPIKDRAQGYLIGYNIGYQLPIGDKVTLDGYVGQCIDGYNGNNKVSRFGDRYVKGIGFQGGLSFGIGF